MREYTLKGQKIISSRDRPNRNKRSDAMDFDVAERYLKDVKRVFDKHEIEFCLMYGTLLGAIREEDFICGDHDVDVVIFKKDLGKIDGALKELDSLGYYHCKTNAVGMVNFGYVARREIAETKVDFYVFHHVKKKNEYWFPRYVNKYKDQGPKEVFIYYPAKFFENMKEIDFKGEKFKVPTPPEEFLEYLWGDGSGRHKWWEPQGGQYGIIPALIFNVGQFEKEFKDE